MGKRLVAYEENAVPFRFVNAAHKILPLMRHTGWYADDYCERLYVGQVYRLNHERGYIPGYSEADSGIVVLDIAEVASDEETAAGWADSLAEREAESERIYSEQSQARQEYEDCREQSRQAWRDAVALARSPRSDARDRAIRRLLADRDSLMTKAEQLAYDYSHTEGWKDY